MPNLRNNKFITLCVIILALGSVTVALISLSRPPAEAETPTDPVEAAAPVQSEVLSTETSAPAETAPAATAEPPVPPAPVITPPAQSAASGSDVTIEFVRPASDSDMEAEEDTDVTS